jgi:hypothetical protein
VKAQEDVLRTTCLSLAAASTTGSSLRASKSKLPPSQLFDILPIRGIILPGKTEHMQFSFFAFPNVKVTGLATCLVEGGPEYQVRSALWTKQQRRVSWCWLGWMWVANVKLDVETLVQMFAWQSSTPLLMLVKGKGPTTQCIHLLLQGLCCLPAPYCLYTTCKVQIHMIS